MRSVLGKKILLLTGIILFCQLPLFAQEKDSLTTRQLMDVEVVEKLRSSVTRESAPVQRIDKERIEQLGFQNVSEAVKRFAGVTIRDYGGIGGLKTISIRSLGAQHTAVSYDGITITDAQTGQVDISRFSLDNVESLSLVMGQADDIFQSARTFAAAGVLSVTIEKPQFINRDFTFQGAVNTGSFGYINPSARYGQKINNTYSFSVHSDWMRADGNYPYETSYDGIYIDGKRINSDIRTFRTEVNVYSDWKKYGQLNLKGYWFDSKRGLPGNLIFREDFSTERQANKNSFLQAVYDNSLSEKLSLRGSAKIDYTRTCYQDFHSRYPDGIHTDQYTQREYYGSLAMNYNFSPAITFVLVEDFFVNTLNASTISQGFPERYSSLTVLAGRYRNSRFTATGSILNTFIKEKPGYRDSQNRTRISPALSFSYRLSGIRNIRIRGSYKDGFRMPTMNDLYYNPVEGEPLRPERADQYNIGISWSGNIPLLRNEYISFSIDGFHSRVRDKILAFPTMGIWQMINQGKVNINGIDMTFSSRTAIIPQHILQIDGSYSCQKALNRNQNDKSYKDQIPYTPVHTGTLSATWLNPWMNISWLVQAVGERYSALQNSEENRMKGYGEHQLSFNRNLSFKKCLVKLHMEVLNIGDNHYDIIRYYPMPGRSFRGGIKVIY